jgi:TFIIF-interacting CTD phosphatase-like protein
MNHICLDLDETIINVSHIPSKQDHFRFKIGHNVYYGQRRPGLKRFLAFLFENFESVNIWTAATQDYADNVIKHIMTPVQRRQLKFLFTRKNIKIDRTGHYSKPLRKIFCTKEAQEHGMNRKTLLMVDDREDMFKNNKGNGMLIPAWHRDGNDKWLTQLIFVLRKMQCVPLKAAKRPHILIDIIPHHKS